MHPRVDVAQGGAKKGNPHILSVSFFDAWNNTVACLI